MAFTVETGEVIADANAYITVAYLEDHFLDRGTSLAAVSTADKQTAIVRATDYVDKRFAPIFKGRKSQSAQSLEWPRVGVWVSGYWVDTSILPSQLKRGIAEYAWVALYVSDLLPTPALSFNVRDVETGTITTSEGGSIIREMERVGPVTEDKWYASPSKTDAFSRAIGVGSSMVSSSFLPEYPVGDEWIKQIVSLGTTKLERA